MQLHPLIHRGRIWHCDARLPARRLLERLSSHPSDCSSTDRLLLLAFSRGGKVSLPNSLDPIHSTLRFPTSGYSRSAASHSLTLCLTSIHWWLIGMSRLDPPADLQLAQSICVWVKRLASPARPISLESPPEHSNLLESPNFSSSECPRQNTRPKKATENKSANVILPLLIIGTYLNPRSFI